MSKLRWGFLAFVIGLAMGCEETEAPKKLTKIEKYTVDTLFNNIKDSLYKEMDTICAAKFDSLYQVSIDSIKAVRLAEIENLLNEK